jgi:hypothetical protein
MMSSVQKKLAAGLKAILPIAVTQRLQAWWQDAAIRRLLLWPPFGAVASHDLLRRTSPISRLYGADRGAIGPERWPYYWCFRPASVERLITDAFPGGGVCVESAGNVLAAIAFLHGLALEEVDRTALDVHDPAYPVVVCVRAVK